MSYEKMMLQTPAISEDNIKELFHKILDKKANFVLVMIPCISLQNRLIILPNNFA